MGKKYPSGVSLPLRWGLSSTVRLGSKVIGIYNDLRFVVEKNPTTSVGAPTIEILKTLITETKDSGGDAVLSDKMLDTLKVSRGTPISAADALAVAGQLMKMTG